MENKVKKDNLSLHKYLFTVTTFSKLSAMILFIALPFLGFYLGIKYQQQLTAGNSNTSDAKKTVTSIPTPNLIPKYSITILNKPDLVNNTFNINAYVKNISVTPFITNFDLNQCSFIDDRNNLYEGFFTNGAGFRFSKALLPNESTNITIKNLNVSVNGLSGYSESTYKKCSYDNSGNYVCTPVTGIKIVSCNASISTSGGGTDTHNGAMLLKVEFPK